MLKLIMCLVISDIFVLLWVVCTSSCVLDILLDYGCRLSHFCAMIDEDISLHTEFSLTVKCLCSIFMIAFLQRDNLFQMQPQRLK